jgi:hypothetical protein
VNSNKSYFFRSFLILLLSAGFFYAFKDFLPKKIFSEQPKNTSNILIDSMLIDAFSGEKITDSTAIVRDTLVNLVTDTIDTHGVTFPEETFNDYSGNQNLIPFFEKLYQLETNKKGTIRIAYFGDSMTDGDFIVQDFRNAFQTQYGGQGVGFVSIVNESARSRGSILHDYSENWKMQSFVNVKNPIRAFGVNGRVFFANDTVTFPWVKYKASKMQNNLKLYNPTLFYGSSSNESGFIKYVIGTDTLRKKLVATSNLNTLNLTPNTLKTLKVKFIKAKNMPVYGFNFDDGQGIHVDNFSQRGNSGIPISKLDIDLMQAFQKKLDYDLMVLHYGTNVLNYGSKDYNWYEKSMSKAVERLQVAFPGVSILIVSTADKSTKYDLEMKTDSAVVPLTLAQKRFAQKTKSGYINLYQLMGGAGSMTKWVEGEVVLANKDYTHFNAKGSKKVGLLVYDQLNKGYQAYKTMRVKDTIPTQTTNNQLDSIKTNTVNEK